MYIKDVSILVAELNKFYAYIQENDSMTSGTCCESVSFTDSSGLLGREEDYKLKNAIEGLKLLQVASWKKNWIGTGKIAEKANKAISKAGNLVNPNQQIDFKNRLNPAHPKYKAEAEQTLYDIFCGTDPESAFKQATKTFGAKYDTVAFLFFMKSYDRFLPISPGNFDKAFMTLGIDFSTSFHCGWSNYCEFISIVKEVQGIMNEVLPLTADARLIDAHSFLWVICQDRYRKWEPSQDVRTQIEARTEECITKLSESKSAKHTINTSVYCRSAQVVHQTRSRAKGCCQLCNQPAPFVDKNGNPYLEVHHIVWLSRGGSDDISNTVALCPNCHAKMHIVDNPLDIDFLKQIATRNS